MAVTSAWKVLKAREEDECVEQEGTPANHPLPAPGVADLGSRDPDSAYSGAPQIQETLMEQP